MQQLCTFQSRRSHEEQDAVIKAASSNASARQSSASVPEVSAKNLAASDDLRKKRLGEMSRSLLYVGMISSGDEHSNRSRNKAAQRYKGE